jgi:hypothetical protein
MRRKSDRSWNITTKFQTNLVAGLLNNRRQGNPHLSAKVPAQGTDKKASAGHHAQPPQTQYTNAKGAAEYLGISKATFCRLKAKGFFQPSPVTGRYHLDDLDREARGTLSRPNGCDAADAQTQKTFGHPESTQPPAPSGSVLN